MSMLKNFLIGIAAIFLLSTNAGCGGDSATENRTPVTEERPASQSKAEETLIGQWSFVEKDSSGVVTAITILDISTEKSATLDTYNLTASKFSENEPVQIFWQVGSVQADIKRSDKTLTFTANDLELLELKYDGQNLSQDKMIFTKQPLDLENLRAQSVSQYQKNIGERSEVIQDMTQAEYKDYINQKIFGIR